MFKTVKQTTRLPVCDVLLPEENVTTLCRHSILLPNTVRCIISGPSNCGKTTLLLTLLTHINGLKFQALYVYSKTLNQPAYQFLQQVLSAIPGLKQSYFSQHEAVVNPNETTPHSIFIFDDVICDKQNHMKNYFSLGRHYNVDVIYLCQTYTHLPKHLVRDNANVIILFQQDKGNLKHVYDDHVTTDMSFEHFQNLCAYCWSDTKYGYVVIDKDSALHHGRYRKGLDQYVSW